MASLITIYWRDIPAQVVAEQGRGRARQQAKAEMPRRFGIAIDEAAMRDKSTSTDDYLSEWRKSEPEPITGDMESAVQERMAELDKIYDNQKLAALVANAGVAEDSDEM